MADTLPIQFEIRELINCDIPSIFSMVTVFMGLLIRQKAASVAPSPPRRIFYPKTVSSPPNPPNPRPDPKHPHPIQFWFGCSTFCSGLTVILTHFLDDVTKPDWKRGLFQII
jgi:hypothetical protein